MRDHTRRSVARGSLPPQFHPGRHILLHRCTRGSPVYAAGTSIAKLRLAFRVVRNERPFDIDAIVILPDHLHAVFTLPDGDADFPLRWRRIKTVFTQAVIADGATFKRRDGGGRTLWQRRFWEHTIRDTTDFNRHVDYIHYNPTKHGYVVNPLDWPYSSLHQFVRDGVLPPDWGKVAGADGFGEPSRSACGPAKCL